MRTQQDLERLNLITSTPLDGTVSDDGGRFFYPYFRDSNLSAWHIAKAPSGMSDDEFYRELMDKSWYCILEGNRRHYIRVKSIKDHDTLRLVKMDLFTHMGVQDVVSLDDAGLPVRREDALMDYLHQEQAAQ